MAGIFGAEPVDGQTGGSQFFLDQSQKQTEFTGVVDAQKKGWKEARMTVPVRPAPPPPARTAPPVRTPPLQEPSGPRIGPSVEGQPQVPNGPGFFQRYTPGGANGGVYITNLPEPLAVVLPQNDGTFMLRNYGHYGVGFASGDEVERIYQEQQTRMHGTEVPPVEKPRVEVDSLPDGQIPTTTQLKPGQRERDATCHPNGGWELDPGFATRPKHTRDYEAQITHAPGLDYVVRNPGQNPVKFDGCAVWNPQHQLLEAKGPGYEGLHANAAQYGFYNSILSKDVAQAERQAKAADGRAVEWHVAEKAAVMHFENAVATGVELSPCGGNFDVQHTPAK